MLIFEASTGLKVNLRNSKLYGDGNAVNVGELAALLGCQVAELPTIDLGLPLGAKYKSKAIWDPVLENEKEVVSAERKVFI